MSKNYDSGYNFDVIDRVILYSMKHAHIMSDEFDKLVNYYNKNSAQLLEDMLAIQSSVSDDDDYHSKKLAEMAGSTAGNIGQNNFTFNLKYLIDSRKKIYSQIREVPEDVLLSNPMVKIFFYDLLPAPAENGSRLVLSAIMLDWREYSNQYFSIVN